MATLASTVAIPAPTNADFVNGEVGVGLPGTPGGSTVYHFTRKITVERSGLYLMKLHVRGVAEVRTGATLATLAQVLTPPSGKTIRTQLYLRKGVNRISIKVTPTQAFVFAMLLFHPDAVFYTSTAAGWVYQVGGATDVIPDVDVPDDAGAALPVFAVMPNWGSAITERIAYLTDILVSETSKEQARSLRMHPRRSFEAEFLRKGSQRVRLDNLLIGIGRRPFWLPLWHEKHRVAGGMTPSTTTTVFPAGTLALREFRVGDRVMVSLGDPDDIEILTVGALDYDTDTLTWLVSPTHSWASGVMLFPLRKAIIADQGQFSAPVDDIMRGSLRFDLSEPDYRFGAAMEAVANIWPFRVNRGEDLSFTYARTTFSVDNEVGPVTYSDPGDVTLITSRASLTIRGRSEAVAFRRFIDMAAGRAGYFYMPTLMRNLIPVGTSITGDTLDVVKSGFTEYQTGLQRSRSIIALVFKDSTPPFYSLISDVQVVGEVERITLVTALPTTNVADLERIEFMVPSRFDQDTFELSHLTDQSAVITTSVVTRSLDPNDMPPIL